jgi:hypothetical protein
MGMTESAREDPERAISDRLPDLLLEYLGGSLAPKPAIPASPEGLPRTLQQR